MIDSVVRNKVEIHQHDADETRHDVEHRELLGVVAAMDDELKGRIGRLRANLGGRSRSSAVVRDAERGGRAADDDRVGRIRVEQQRGLSPRSTARAKFGGILRTKSSIALREVALAVALGRDFADVVIAGILQRGDDPAFVIRMIGGENVGRQIMRVRN